jgi:hypothetical protein
MRRDGIIVPDLIVGRLVRFSAEYIIDFEKKNVVGQ